MRCMNEYVGCMVTRSSLQLPCIGDQAVMHVLPAGRRHGRELSVGSATVASYDNEKYRGLEPEVEKAVVNTTTVTVSK